MENSNVISTCYVIQDPLTGPMTTVYLYKPDLSVEAAEYAEVYHVLEFSNVFTARAYIRQQVPNWIIIDISKTA